MATESDRMAEMLERQAELLEQVQPVRQEDSQRYFQTDHTYDNIGNSIDAHYTSRFHCRFPCAKIRDTQRPGRNR